ncbi:MAG: hypothetical protein GX676_03965 [Bacilli bacterium]|nr:hypothetical protein [Bacilli bacterium]
MKKIKKIALSVLFLFALLLCLNFGKNTTVLNDTIDPIPLPFNPVPANFIVWKK